MSLVSRKADIELNVYPGLMGTATADGVHSLEVTYSCSKISRWWPLLGCVCCAKLWLVCQQHPFLRKADLIVTLTHVRVTTRLEDCVVFYVKITLESTIGPKCCSISLRGGHAWKHITLFLRQPHCWHTGDILATKGMGPVYLKDTFPQESALLL